MDDMQNREEVSFGMTDNQSRRFEELIRENEALRRESGKESGDGMTDYQFKSFLKAQHKLLESMFMAGRSQEEILSVFAPKDD